MVSGNKTLADNTGWCAIQAVYGRDVKHLVCKWHVDQYVFFVLSGHCNSSLVPGLRPPRKKRGPQIVQGVPDPLPPW